MKRRNGTPYGAVDLPAVLERHFRAQGAHPIGSFCYRGLRVFLADGGPHHDAKYMQLSVTDAWMRHGYWMTVWALQRGRRIIGQPLYFPLSQDAAEPAEARRRVRLEAARDVARRHIDHGLEGGLYG